MSRKMLGLMVVALGLCVAPLSASAFHIHLHGLVTEYFTGDQMKGVQVRLVKDSIERETVITSGNGRYELYLERGYDYVVWFHRSDMVTKHVRIDAREIPLFRMCPSMTWTCRSPCSNGSRALTSRSSMRPSAWPPTNIRCAT